MINLSSHSRFWERTNVPDQIKRRSRLACTLLKEELSRSFDFRGRTARGGYLAFLVTATCILAGTLWLAAQISAHDKFWWNALMIVAVFYIPVTSAGVRRLHDAGHSGVFMLDPLKPTVVFLVITYLGRMLFVGGFSLVALDGSFALVTLFAAPFAFFVWMIAFLGCFVATMVYFANTMGLLLLPSQPGTNAYGPNPHEVTP